MTSGMTSVNQIFIIGEDNIVVRRQTKLNGSVIDRWKRRLWMIPQFFCNDSWKSTKSLYGTTGSVVVSGDPRTRVVNNLRDVTSEQEIKEQT
jgi:hypothetical protein